LEREVTELCDVNRVVYLNLQTACAKMTLRVLRVGEDDGVLVI
jgi:dTDP-4-amino-4,6-dideoxygalactose transaminase